MERAYTGNINNLLLVVIWLRLHIFLYVLLFYFIFHRQNQVLQDGGIIRSVTMTSYMISLQKIELQGKGQ